jgi:hypothetical protein
MATTSIDELQNQRTALEQKREQLKGTINDLSTRVQTIDVDLRGSGFTSTGGPTGNPTVDAVIAQRAALSTQRIEVVKEANQVGKDINAINQQITNAQSDANPASTIKNSGATNESASNAQSAAKMADGTRVPDSGTTQSKETNKVVSSQGDDDGNVTTVYADGKREVRDANGKVIPLGGGRVETPATAQWAGARDLRVLLRIPPEYLIYSSSLKAMQGILFPYTPSIGYESKANYSAINPMHSNYTQYAFKNSEVTNISVTAKLSVQNEQEAVWWLAIQHVLRS